MSLMGQAAYVSRAANGSLLQGGRPWLRQAVLVAQREQFLRRSHGRSHVTASHLSLANKRKAERQRWWMLQSLRQFPGIAL